MLNIKQKFCIYMLNVCIASLFLGICYRNHQSSWLKGQKTSLVKDFFSHLLFWWWGWRALSKTQVQILIHIILTINFWIDSFSVNKGLYLNKCQEVEGSRRWTQMQLLRQEAGSGKNKKQALFSKLNKTKKKKTRKPGTKTDKRGQKQSSNQG